MYPAYPRHCFSLRGLVHICIPHTGTPCGRVMGQRSYGLSWVTPFGIALPSPFVPLLYHTLRGLSRGFFEIFSNFFCPFLSIRSGLVSPAYLASPLDFSYIVSQLGRFVKGFQKISFLLFESTEQPHAQAMSLLPLGVGVLTSP